MRTTQKCRSGQSRSGKVNLDSGRSFRIPSLWFSVWTEDEYRKRYKEFLRYDFRENLLFNVCHILARPYLRKRLSGEDIHKTLGFKGPIMADSGGFLFRYASKMDVHPLKVLEVQEELKADVGLVLDHPPNPRLVANEAFRFKTTLRNTKIMLRSRKSNNLLLLPVVSALSIEELKRMITCLRKIVSLEAVCIGGLVPLIRTQIPNGRKIMVNLLIELRRLLPESFIHVLGVGGTTTMHLMFFLGADSTDSCAWEKKAAYGLIQLPKVGDRFIVKRPGRERYPALSVNEYRMLLDCDCPACGNNSPEDLDKSRILRVIHNAWVFQQEVYEARRAVEEGDYERFVEERTRHSMMYSTFEYARSKLDR